VNYSNTSEHARKAIRQFNAILKRANNDDEVFFSLWQYEINALLKAGLIEPEPARGWFDRIFWRGQQFRVTQGYPNIIIYKRAHVK
jgi:hypothetical protein